MVGRALVGDAAEYPRMFNFHVRLFEYAWAYDEAILPDGIKEPVSEEAGQI